ncbi:hypothetical protein GGH99_005607, partial [Coemansia sp. RSA 1285]
TYCLQRLLTAVDIVAQKQIVCLWREPAVFKEPQEIVVLPVNVAADLNRRLELQKNRLVDENLARRYAKPVDLCLVKLDLLAGTRAAN